MEADVWPPKYIIQQHMIDSLKFFESLGRDWDIFLNNS